MKYSAAFLIGMFILAAGVAHADISTTQRQVSISMAFAQNSTHARDDGLLSLHCNVLGTGVLNTTTKELTTNGITGYCRLPGHQAFSTANGTAANNNGAYIWYVKAVDDGTNDYMLKVGAGTPSSQDYCQWASSNNWRTDTWNGSGTNEFSSSNLACVPGVWQMFAKTINSAGLTRTYTCVENGTLQTGSTFTPTGGTYRTPSTDAVLFGDSANSVNGSIGGLRFYNRSVSVTELQSLCEQMKNFDRDNITITVNPALSNGTLNSSIGVNTQPPILASNETINPWCPRADTNGDGSEDSCMTSGNISLVKNVTINITGEWGAIRSQLTPNSMRNGSGALAACSNSAYQSICMLASQCKWAYENNLECIITTSGTDTDLQTSLGLCSVDSDAPASNVYTYANRRAEEIAIVMNLTGNPVFPAGHDRAGQSTITFEGRNEPDLAQFFCTNVSSRSNSALTGYIVNESSAIENVFRAYNNSNATIQSQVRALRIGLPPLSAVNATDQTYWRTALYGNRTRYPTTIPGFFHNYGYDYWNAGLRYDIELANSIAMHMSSCSAAGYNDSTCRIIYITEGDCGYAPDQNGTNGQYGSDSNAACIASGIQYVVNHPEYNIKYVHYVLTAWGTYNVPVSASYCSEPRNHCVIDNPNTPTGITYFSSYSPLQRVSTYHDRGSTVIPIDTSDYYIVGSFSKQGGQFYVTLTNTGDANRSVNFSMSGNGNFTAMRNVVSGSSFTATSNAALITDLQAKKSNTYLLTMVNTSIQSTTPSTFNVSIAEPSNRTFNISVYNPNSVTVQYLWYLNGTLQSAYTNLTHYNFSGNYTSQGNWNVTVNVETETNNLTYSWNLTVNDTASNSAPLVYLSQVNIDPTIGISNDLIGYCAASDADADNVYYDGIWWNGSSIYKYVNLTSWAYQESANVTNQTGGDGRGLIYTGTYTTTGTGSCNEMQKNYDGLYTQLPQGYTDCSNANTDVYFNQNWTMPYNTHNAKFSVAINQSVFPNPAPLVNITLPQACLRTNVEMKVRVSIPVPVGELSNATIYCYNGTADEQLLQMQFNGVVWYYDSAMWWNTTTPFTPSVNAERDRLTAGTVAHGETWTWSCRANDGQANSSYLNSTSTTGVDDIDPSVSVQTIPASPVARDSVLIIGTVTDQGTAVNTVNLTITRGAVTLVSSPMSVYASNQWSYTFNDTETSGEYIITVMANDTANNEGTGTTSFTISGTGGGGGGGGGGGSPPPTGDGSSTVGGSGGGVTSIIKFINTTFKSEIPRIDTIKFLDLYKPEEGDIQEYTIFTNRLLKECTIYSVGEDTPMSAFKCTVNQSTIHIQATIQDASEAFSKTYEATIVAVSENGETMKIPVRINTISLRVTDDNDKFLAGKAAIIAGGIILTFLGLRRLFAQGSIRVR